MAKNPQASPDTTEKASPGPAATSAAPVGCRAAYHDGPPEMHFAGRLWLQGVPQTVSDEEWSRIVARSGPEHYGFALIEE